MKETRESYIIQPTVPWSVRPLSIGDLQFDVIEYAKRTVHLKEAACYTPEAYSAWLDSEDLLAAAVYALEAREAAVDIH